MAWLLGIPRWAKPLLYPGVNKHRCEENNLQIVGEPTSILVYRRVNTQEKGIYRSKIKTGFKKETMF
jgi:hypothetical protein